MNRQAIAPVIAVTLLLVTAVLSAVFFQTWFQTFQSGLLIDVESQSQANNFRIGIEDLLGEELFVNAGDGLNITKISIDGNDCNFTGVVTGVSGINVSDCMDNLTTNTPNIVLVTNSGVISEKVFVRDEFVGGEETGSLLITPFPGPGFISTWNTSITGTGTVSGLNQIALPLEADGTYNFTVSGNNLIGSPVHITSHTQNILNFNSSGIQTINITGEIIGWRFNNGGDRRKIIEISQWGRLRVGNSGSYFYGADNLIISAIDPLDLNGTTNLYQMFRMTPGDNNFNVTGDINNWDVSGITGIGNLFRDASIFTSDLSSWNVSNVNNMGYAFWGANSFNSDLSSWDVSNVNTMERMFRDASVFASNISSWNVGNVTVMGNTFWGASSFNSDLSSWNVSKVTNMRGMFRDAINFNSDLSSWDVSNVNSMTYMFQGANNFNSDLSSWNVSRVTNMGSLFRDAINFNSNLSSWNVNNVTTMNSMFLNAISFNQDLSSWCVPLISSESFNFDTNTPAWDPKIGRQPQWNTSC